MKKIKLKIKKKPIIEEPEEIQEESESTRKVLCIHSKNNRCMGQKYKCPHSVPHTYSDACDAQCSLLNSIDKSFKCEDVGE